MRSRKIKPINGMVDLRSNFKIAVIHSLYKGLTDASNIDFWKINQYITNLLNLCNNSDDIYHGLPKIIYNVVKVQKIELRGYSRPTELNAFIQNNQECLDLIQEQLLLNLLEK